MGDTFPSVNIDLEVEQPHMKAAYTCSWRGEGTGNNGVEIPKNLLNREKIYIKMWGNLYDADPADIYKFLKRYPKSDIGYAIVFPIIMLGLIWKPPMKSIPLIILDEKPQQQLF